MIDKNLYEISETDSSIEEKYLAIVFRIEDGCRRVHNVATGNNKSKLMAWVRQELKARV